MTHELQQLYDSSASTITLNNNGPRQAHDMVLIATFRPLAIKRDTHSVGSVAKGLNNERRVVHHVASSILGSDTLLSLHSLAK